MRGRACSRSTCAVALTLALALACAPGLGPACALSRAWADEVEDAQAALDSAEQRMDGIASEYDALKQEVEGLQTRIDDITAQALEAQQAVIAGREALGKAAVHEYRTGGSAQSLLSLVLEAQDFNELVRNLAYLESVVRFHADEVEAQKERSAQFDKLVSDLNFQKDEQEKTLAELETKRAEAQSVLSDAASRLQNAESEQVVRLEALKKQAEELAAAEQAAAEAPVVEDATTVDRDEVAAPDTPVEPNPDPNPPSPAPSPQPEAAPDPGATWSTGVASAYGGSTDPNTPNPGRTATGAVCDDNSMGVAIPTSMPNYSSYLGRTVEISYGGMTVLATVNDTGNMGGGSRALDLQPGVWKALGATSCLDWGVRTVSYRFL